MLDAFLGWFLPSLIATACALLASGFKTLSFHRRITKLELLVGDIEERQNKVRGREAAKIRWDEKAWTDSLLAHEQRTPAVPKRYDNDPVS